MKQQLEHAATTAEFTASLPTLSARQDYGRGRWSGVDNRIYAPLGFASVAVIDPKTQQMEGELNWPSHPWEMQPNGRLRVDYTWENNQGDLIATDFLSTKTVWKRPIEAVPRVTTFSPDGTRLLIIYNPRLDEENCLVEVLASGSGELVTRGTMNEIPNDMDSGNIALLDDRRVLFARGYRGFPVVLDIESGKAVREKSLPSDGRAYEGDSTDGYASPDGRYLAYLDRDGWGHGFELRVWDLRAAGGSAMVVRRERDDGTSCLNGADFSKDGRFVALNSEGVFEIYELPMGRLRLTAKPGGAALFSPDSKRVAIIRGPQMQIVELPGEDSAEPVELPEEDPIDDLRGFDIDAAGEWIVANDRRHVLVWKVGTPFPVRIIADPTGNTFDRPSLDPAAKYLIAGDAMHVWSWPTAGEGKAHPIVKWNRGPLRPFSATFMADGRELGLVRFGSAWVVELEEADPPMRGRIRTLALQSRTAHCNLENSAFAADGSRFAFADRNHVKLYNLKPEKLLRETRVPETPAAFSRDAKLSAQKDGNSSEEISVVNLETGKTVVLIPWWVEKERHGLGDFYKMAFSESGDQLAVGFSDEKAPGFGVAVFDLGSGKLDQIIWTQRGVVDGIEFCRKDSRIAVLNRDRSIQVFERKPGDGL